MSTVAKERALGERLRRYIDRTDVASVGVDSASASVTIRTSLDDVRIVLRFSAAIDGFSFDRAELTKSGIARLGDSALEFRPRRRDRAVLALAGDVLGDSPEARRLRVLCARCIAFARDDALTVEDIDAD